MTRKEVIRQFIRFFKRNLLEVIRKEAGPAYIERILEEYELQLEGIAPLTDPTAPEHLKEEFTNLLYNDLENKTKFENGKLIIEIGDEEALGYDDPPDPKETNLLKTFIYILEGVFGEYAWLSDEYWMARLGRIPEEKGGRAGAGFLLSKEDFIAEGHDNYINFEEVRWGFSDQGAKDIFDDAARNFNWQPYLEKALDRTIKEFKARGR